MSILYLKLRCKREIDLTQIFLGAVPFKNVDDSHNLTKFFSILRCKFMTELKRPKVHCFEKLFFEWIENFTDVNSNVASSGIFNPNCLPMFAKNEVVYHIFSTSPVADPA